MLLNNFLILSLYDRMLIYTIPSSVGPHSHLFHNVHEQHYVFHAISYAAKIGDYYGTSSGTIPNINVVYICITTTIAVLFTTLKI